MAKIWSDESKLGAWLEVELAATAAWSELGVVPADAAAALAERATAPTPERVAELEATLHHDTAAFVDAVAERLGEEGRWFHYGLTSSDVVDTALSLQIRQAGALILEGVDRAFAVVAARAEEQRETLQMGRTHGVHAEPTTFGLKLAGWAFELVRGRDVRRHRPGAGADRVRAARARTGADLDADPPARPPRRAARRARRPRVLARLLRARDPPPGTDGGRRGAGAVRAWPEGLVGDAAQAQPGRRGANLRARARRPLARARGARERGALARARHLPLLRRARGDPGRVPRARLHARPLRLARRGPRRAARADAPQPRVEPLPLLQPARPQRARRIGTRPQRRLPPRPAQRHARLGGGARLPRALPLGRGDRRPRRPRFRLRPRRLHAPCRHRVRPPTRPREGASPCLKPPSTSHPERCASSMRSTTRPSWSSRATGSPPSTSSCRPRSPTRDA